MKRRARSTIHLTMPTSSAAATPIILTRWIRRIPVDLRMTAVMTDPSRRNRNFRNRAITSLIAIPTPIRLVPMRLDVALRTATILRTMMPVTMTPRSVMGANMIPGALMAAIVTALIHSTQTDTTVVDTTVVDTTVVHTTQADMTTI